LGKKAPSFSAKAVVNGHEIVEKLLFRTVFWQAIRGILFYPADFTFVCPTEIIAFQDKIEEFNKEMLLW
jgi:peroxiredoxin (alkyl hydroperoxide reductase subunit C)